LEFGYAFDEDVDVPPPYRTLWTVISHVSVCDTSKSTVIME